MTDKQIAELRALYSALHESSHAPFMAYIKVFLGLHNIEVYVRGAVCRLHSIEVLSGENRLHRCPKYFYAEGQII